MNRVVSMTGPYYRNTTDYQGLAKKFPGFQVPRRYISCSQDCATGMKVQFSIIFHRQVFSVGTAVLVNPRITLYVFSFICNITHRSHPKCDHPNLWISIWKLAFEVCFGLLLLSARSRYPLNPLLKHLCHIVYINEWYQVSQQYQRIRAN